VKSLRDGKALTDTNKNTCTLAAKSTTQKRSKELKHIGVQRQRNKMILSYACEDPVSNINWCVKFAIPLIFTEI